MAWPQPIGAVMRGSLIFGGGRGDFIEKYLETYAHWHAAGWNVASFDWRGQGGSRGEIVGGHLDSFDPLVADGDALLRDWIASMPGPHVAIGHSMGGHILLRILAERRPPLAAAVLVAPMLRINTAPAPAWLGRLLAAAMSRAGRRHQPSWRETNSGTPGGKIRERNLTRCPERYADEQYWKAREPGFELGPPSWGWLAAAFQSMLRPSADELRTLDLPMLLLGTDGDRLVSPDAIRTAAALIPNAELLMFSDAAHELLRECDEARLPALARIDAFLDRYTR